MNEIRTQEVDITMDSLEETQYKVIIDSYMQTNWIAGKGIHS